MINRNKDTDYDLEIFGDLLAEQQTNNKRVAVRYVRTDIVIMLITTHFHYLQKKTHVELIDISSKGMAIQCKSKLAINKKVTLELIFEDRQIFTIPAIIIHQINKEKYEYGLKFLQFNHDLGEHLLSSQVDLIFK